MVPVLRTGCQVTPDLMDRFGNEDDEERYSTDFNGAWPGEPRSRPIGGSDYQILGGMNHIRD